MNDLFSNIIPALILVIVLILGMSLIYKKKRKSSGLIELIEYRSFGQKLAIAAMKINKHIFILGITPNDMKVLDKVDEGVLTAIPNTGEPNPCISEKIKRLQKIKEEL
jgi:flagellar biogenesis protein FliO